MDTAPTLPGFPGLVPSAMHGTSRRPPLAADMQAREFAWDERDVGADRCGVSLLACIERQPRNEFATPLPAAVGLA